MITKQGNRLYDEPIVENVDPRGKKYYWIDGDELVFLEIENTDMIAIKEGYVSVTPIGLDLTNFGHIDKLKLDLIEK